MASLPTEAHGKDSSDLQAGTMLSKRAKQRLRAREHEAQALDKATTELGELRQRFSDASSLAKQQLLDAVDAFQGSCQPLAARRASCIQKLSSKHPTAARQLEDDAFYSIPVFDRAIFDCGGLTIGYMPADDTFGRESPDAVAPSTAATAPKETIPRDRTATAPITYPFQPNCTLQPPVRTSEVSRKHYWVFSYPVKRNTPCLFMLRCPSPSCQSPIFTRHPLKRDRAVEHFEACGVAAGSKWDIVRRYARQVMHTHRHKQVSSTWVRKHNRRLTGLQGEGLEDLEDEIASDCDP